VALGHILGIATTTGCGHRDCENAQDRFRPLFFRRCLVAEKEHRARQSGNYTDRHFGGILRTARWHLNHGAPVVVTLRGEGEVFASGIADVAEDSITLWRGQRRQTFMASAVVGIRRAP
jgi:hypothetical protein